MPCNLQASFSLLKGHSLSDSVGSCCRCDACCRGDADVAPEAAQVGLRCSLDGCSGAVVLSGDEAQLTSLHEVPASWLPEQCTRLAPNCSVLRLGSCSISHSAAKLASGMILCTWRSPDPSACGLVLIAAFVLFTRCGAAALAKGRRADVLAELQRARMLLGQASDASTPAEAAAALQACLQVWT